MAILYDHSAGIVPVYLGGPEPLYLLMKQHSGYWSFPKGHPEEGETLQETAARELLEEAGIAEFSLLPIPPVPIHYSFQRGPDKHQKTVTLYGAEVFSQDVTMQAKEIQDHAWLTYEAAKTQFNYSSNVAALDAVHTYLESLKNS
jgi:8-oxo-dGTP pyrophosphatase MutT (NUDIX family)